MVEQYRVTVLKSYFFARLIGFLCVLLLLNACGISKINPKATTVDHVYFFQNGASYAIKDDVAELRLKREAFAIHFFNKRSSPEQEDYYVTRIVAVPNQEDLDKITIGMDADKTPNMGSGDALAVSTKTGYDKQLFINDYGYHILFYANEENRTVDVIGKKKEYLLFQFEVVSIFDKPDFIPIAESNLEKIYFGIYSDFNQNKTIDAGELTKIVLHLE